ncbi:MAG: alpha/beta fold hydrolase, partial [Candidatus Levyibacteriota bacterium]
MLYEEKYFEYRKMRLYYFIMGEDKPLFFLPGGLRVTTYLQNIHLLSRYYKVIAVDLPGFGKSSTPPDAWSLENYADLLSHFLDFLKLPKVAAVGHSYGGGVGLYLAIRQRLTKLVVFSPMGVASDHNPVVFFFNVLVTKSVNDFLAMKTNRMRSFIFNNAISTVTENFSNVTKMAQVTYKVLYRTTTPEQLRKIKIPVKLLWGKHDELFPVQNGYYLQ